MGRKWMSHLRSPAMLAVAAGIVSLVGTPSVSAAPKLVSTSDPAGDQGGMHIAFKAMTPDASDVFFETDAWLTTDDPEDYRNLDLFVHRDGRSELVSVADYEAEAYYADSSADGRRVFFQIHDGAGVMSLYRWEDGEAIRIGPAGNDVFASRDGDVVFYESRGTIRRWEAGESVIIAGEENRAQGMVLSAASADGERAVFETNAALTPTDRDSYSRDVYAYDDSGIELLSVGGSEELEARFHAASPDARRVIIGTAAELVRDPEDSALSGGGTNFDLFERFNGRTRLLTGGGGSPTEFAAASTDARRVLFESFDGLTRSDRNGTTDLYSSDAGELRQVSRGIGGKRSGGNVYQLLGISSDATAVLFSSAGRFDADDRDANRMDVYCYRRGKIRLVSTGRGAVDHFTGAISANGSTVAYDTSLAVVPGDRDRGADVYATRGGRHLLLTSGSDRTSHATATEAVSAEGGTVIFKTQDPLVTEDLDGSFDLYSARVPARR